MNNLVGFEVDEKFLPNFKWKRDIHYFDGPLLSEYTTDTGDIYIFHWCDVDTNLNNWLAVRVTRRSLIEFTSGLLSTYELLTKRNQDKNPLIMSIDNNGHMVKAKYVPYQSIPEEYLPETDAFVSPYLMPNTENNHYSVLLNGEWDTETLVKIQRRFLDLYALMFQSRFERVKIPSPPMKDGWSSYHYWSSFKQSIPEYFGLNRIVYESPGYIEFTATHNICLTVKKNIDRYMTNKNLIFFQYTRIKKYINDHNLNDKNASTINDEQSTALSEMSKVLLSSFDRPTWEWLNGNMDSTFKASKAALFYIDRLKFMSDLIEQGKISMSEV